MCLQQKVLNDYFGDGERPTIKEVSLDTGIQMTRVHRIMRGSVMRLSEYEIFRQRVRGRGPGITRLQEIVSRIEDSFPEEKIYEIEAILERSLRLASLRDGSGGIE